MAALNEVDNTKKEKLWGRDFFLNLLVAHFLLAGFFSLFIVVPAFIEFQGGEAWEAGIIIATFGLAGVIVRPMAGRWILKSGPKKVVLLGVGLFIGSTILYIPLPSEWWIVPVRMVQGVGLATAPVATTTIVGNLAPEERRGEGMSYMGNSISIAQLYAPVVGVFLMDAIGFSVAFIVAAASGVIALLIATLISDSKTRIPESALPGVDEKTQEGNAPLISKPAIFPTIVFLTYAFAMAPVSVFLYTLASDNGLPENFNIGLYFTVMSGMTMLTTLVSGRISDRLGRGAVIVPGLLLVGLAMLILSGVSSVTLFLGAAFLHGVGYGLIYPGINSLVVDRVPPRERGSALATLQQSWDVGASGGNFILGPVVGVYGVASAFLIVGIGAITGAAGYVIGSRKNL